MKKGTFAGPFLFQAKNASHDDALRPVVIDGDQSRSPPMMPNKASKLWNTLITSKYKVRVALM